MNHKKFINNEIVPARIREARISRGYSLTELADLIGVSSQAISQYELGTSKPGTHVLVKMMGVLNFPLNFFTKPKININNSFCNSAVNFRSMKSASKKLKDAFSCRIQWADEIYQYLRKFVNFPDVDIPNIDHLVKNYEYDADTIERIALYLRKYWKIDRGPIKNLIEILQEKGFVICNIEFGDKKIDAFSQWYNGIPYIIMGTDKASAARARFDIAHELGHLILHPHIDQESLKNKELFDQIENEANYFAGAFLLPVDSFPTEVVSNSLEHFVVLKKRWKVSIQAMIIRCDNLGLLKEHQVRYLFAIINKRGLKTNEPLDDVIPMENPYLFKQAIELLLENNIVSPQEIIDKIALNKEEIDSLCFLPKELLITNSRKPKLTLIKSSCTPSFLK
ncbi:ImmA/IrrE family metallo-endopeptidase [Thermanaerosceptrum fracticalcis]|uniref:ImmA/IrrE family metallo-endopeptidase n=1 Tax=Thermanaerosceptrum fracticalcis TaxID=1712410 RepID=A0A7G6E175_THEFR|nr:ImmA/IrrE family metallo-endopeptidase [Thermanaerosceptrum fracticalcis]QNB45829.1 ImmA/IrrE family metallo-endopeptidase [Thermanaerosceptrum fracticalcis]